VPGDQTIVVIVLFLGPLSFIVEEVLLFDVLVSVMRRFPPLWQSDQRD
jgi:hypothetical protein